MPEYYLLNEISTHRDALASAQVIKELRECRRIANIRLCNVEDQLPGCGLLAEHRDACKINEYDASDAAVGCSRSSYSTFESKPL